MIKLKEIISEQDNTIDKKEWAKVEKVITRGMDNVFDKGVKYLRDYERSNLPPAEHKKRIAKSSKVISSILASQNKLS